MKYEKSLKYGVFLIILFIIGCVIQANAETSLFTETQSTGQKINITLSSAEKIELSKINVSSVFVSNTTLYKGKVLTQGKASDKILFLQYNYTIKIIDKKASYPLRYEYNEMTKEYSKKPIYVYTYRNLTIEEIKKKNQDLLNAQLKRLPTIIKQDVKEEKVTLI